MGGSLGTICCFILGALCAWLGWVPEYLLGHEATVYVLYVLMLLVGFSIGYDRRLGEILRTCGRVCCCCRWRPPPAPLRARLW